MLASRNDYFMESSSKRISELEILVRQKVAQVKCLTVQLDEERKKSATNNSMVEKLNTQVKNIQEGWSEMKVQLAASQKELAAFDQAFAANGELMVDLTRQVADLQTQNEASEESQSELQRRLEGAAAHYQVCDLIGRSAAIYAKGFEEGYRNGVEARGSTGSEEELTDLDADSTI